MSNAIPPLAVGLIVVGLMAWAEDFTMRPHVREWLQRLRSRLDS